MCALVSSPSFARVRSYENLGGRRTGTASGGLIESSLTGIRAMPSRSVD